MTPLLRFDAVSKAYGALRVTDDVSFEIGGAVGAAGSPGAVGAGVGVIGPNGAGKTTLFNLITGDVAPDRGRISFGGADITVAPPHRRCAAGIARTYQIPHPFAGMTVFENVLVGAAFGRGRAERESYDFSVTLLERTGLLTRANALAGALTLLERKRLELARGLATQPRLLLLDEIAGGLTAPEVAVLIETIAQIRADGVTIIWVEHVVHALMSTVDRLLAMHLGRVIADGTPQEVMALPEVRRVYMGIEIV